MVGMLSKLLKKFRLVFVWLYYFSRFSIRQFYRQRGLQIASSLAYATLISLVPLVTVMFRFLKGLPVVENLGTKVQNFIISNFVPAIGDTIQTYLGEFSQAASQLTVTGIAFLIIMALMLLTTIDNALNQIWHVRVRRRPIARFLVYWAILTLGPLLVGLGIISSTYVLSLSFVSNVEASLGLKTRLLSWMPFLASGTAFTLLYILMPNCLVTRRHALIGGIIAAALFEIAKSGFVVYVGTVTTYQDIYGAIAVIPMFLMWIYTSWVIVILGAHITFCLSAFRLRAEMSDAAGSVWNFVDACRVVKALWSAQKTGEALTYSGLRKSGIRLPQYQVNEIMNALHDANWVHMDPKGEWMLSRDMSDLTLMDLYRVIPNRISLHHEHIREDDSSVKLLELLKLHNKNLEETLTIPFATVFPVHMLTDHVEQQQDIQSFSEE